MTLPIRLLNKLKKQGESTESKSTDDSDEMTSPLTEGIAKVEAATPQNIILYGPPGTGKTYSTTRRALELILGKDQRSGAKRPQSPISRVSEEWTNRVRDVPPVLWLRGICRDSISVGAPRESGCSRGVTTAPEQHSGSVSSKCPAYRSKCFPRSILLIAQQTLRNAAHRERFFCRFDEFSEDTLMNRIFRAACRVLLDATHTPSTQDRLRHCLLLLDDVEDVFVHDELFDQITITRQNERFADVLRFCRLILQERSPTVRSGSERSFSLLFDMNRVFEDFVAAFLKKQVIPHLDGYRLYPQAKNQRLHLMKFGGRGVLLLRPDLLIKAPNGGQQFVLDTKWKQLSGEGARGGVGTDDLYQLYAYTRRYECRRSVLLYPHVLGAKCRDFDIVDTSGCTGEQVSVRFVNLRRDLHKRSDRDALACELTRIVKDGFSHLSTQGA